MSNTEDVVTSVRLPRELVDRLDALATEQRRSRSQQLVIVLQRGLAASIPGPFTPSRPKEAEAAVAEKIGRPFEEEHEHRFEVSPTSAFPRRRVCSVPGCDAVQPQGDAGKEGR